jgi:hypothetical protein
MCSWGNVSEFSPAVVSRDDLCLLCCACPLRRHANIAFLSAISLKSSQVSNYQLSVLHSAKSKRREKNQDIVRDYFVAKAPPIFFSTTPD